jgi:hypothetical protein
MGDEPNISGGAVPSTASPPAVPPLLQPPPPRKATTLRDHLAVVLSAGLVLFLADGLVSLANAAAILAFHSHALSGVRAILLLVTLGVLGFIYLLLGFTCLVPKRYFLPVTLFLPLLWLALVPAAIFFRAQLAVVDVVAAALQATLGAAVIFKLLGGLRWRWPMVRTDRLGTRIFSGANLGVFLAANLLVAPLLVAVYLAVCAASAVEHFSGGFLKLRAGGITVQAREYARADGKTVLLVPMIHIGDAGFYEQVSQSFPTNSIILMEGVTDTHNLLTNRLSYRRAATSLGLSEQQDAFRPTRGKLVRADVDISEFSPTTIGLLNFAMLIHSKGFTAKSILEAAEHPTPPDLEEILVDDLLNRRNQHLLNEINARLPKWDKIVIPWGAAHIPGIAEELQKLGFVAVDSRDYRVIRFLGRDTAASQPR